MSNVLFSITKLVRDMFNSGVAMILLVGWILGVVIAKGAVSVFFSIIIPFYAWYLVIEKIAIDSGFL